MEKKQYTLEHKADVVKKVDALRDTGLEAKEACEKAGVSWWSYQNWKKLFPSEFRRSKSSLPKKKARTPSLYQKANGVKPAPSLVSLPIPAVQLDAAPVSSGLVMITDLATAIRLLKQGGGN